MSTEKESLLKFPCEFPIKVMGKATDEFELFVLEVMRKHVINIQENAIESRKSENGNYLSVTVTINATSKEQLDAIYRELTASQLVLMAL